MLESRQISWPVYLISASLILVPLADAFTSLYPWNFGDARWRFGAVGLLSNAVLLPLLGILIAYVTSALLNHQALRTIIGWVCLVGAVIGLGAIVMFALDALQTRAQIRPEMSTSFTVASITAAFKSLLASATLLALGLSARRGRKTAKGKDAAEVPLFTADATQNRASKSKS